MIVFEKPGRENLEQTVDLAIQAAQDRGIGTIVAPSSKGDTARYLVKALDAGLNVVAVTLCNGFKTPGEQAFPADLRAELTEKGMHILTASHVLSGAERGLSTRFQGVYPVEVMAHTLRTVSYTHLDVYKRQGSAIIPPGTDCEPFGGCFGGGNEPKWAGWGTC